MTGRRARALDARPLGWLGALLALYLAVPLGAFLLRFATTGDDRGFGEPGLWDAARTSAVSATISAAIVLVLGVPLGYWLAHARGPLQRVVGMLVQLPLALPPVMSGIVLIYLVGPYTWLGERFGGRLTDSLAGVIIAQTFVAAPFLVIAARSAFAAVDPELDDIAATLGHRPLARFARVDLRIAAPAIRAGLLLTWLRAIGEYGATVLLAYHPYTLPVFTAVQFQSTGIPSTQAPTAVALGTAAIVLLAAGFRLPRRLRGRMTQAASVPEPTHPPAVAPAALSFDLDTRVGDFHLRMAHQARSSRVAVLGASGAGKSMLLRALAGLLGPDVGTVRCGPDDLSRVPVEQRQLGYVPQRHGLLPDRTAWQQATFGVRADGGVAAWWFETLRLQGLHSRLPDQLSGGQRQRVGLAAALSQTPRLVLLDEPFTALDAPVRQELVTELRRLQRRDALSTVVVTHDPQEAAMLADELLVVADGRIVQSGSVREVFDAPASPQVARLLGIENVLEGVADGGELVAGAVQLPVRTWLPAGTPLTWCVAPQDVLLGTSGVAATVVDVADVGTSVLVDVELEGGPALRARCATNSPAARLAAGAPVSVDFRADSVTVWPQAASALDNALR
ncbi:ATP-binding cassette domain-containing protein [Flexivirga sp. ID2601S]|uniref:ATP-binding cassette domain-containing protein n=1 Tax=Flexivirga aerilata TaxID=1656889 RepID=A0A849AD12_9MICO|nr:ATP-binding cassette domain-containing protein [Flexivirga aerilata]NNG38359.1 ATP-binding cassette domain-containing protein [Flexivirga aerilata]